MGEDADNKALDEAVAEFNKKHYGCTNHPMGVKVVARPQSEDEKKKCIDQLRRVVGQDNGFAIINNGLPGTAVHVPGASFSSRTNPEELDANKRYPNDADFELIVNSILETWRTEAKEKSENKR